MSANGGCFCKGDSLMSVTVGVVSFGFLSMFGLLIPTGITTLGAISQAHSQTASDPNVSSGLGVVLTAMFIACAAYVAAGVSAILDLRFIAINKRRNFIITTVGYVAALFFLVTGGITIFSNISVFIFFSTSTTTISGLAVLIEVIQFISCVILMGCYATYLLLQPYIEEKQKMNTSVSSYELHHDQSEMQ